MNDTAIAHNNRIMIIRKSLLHPKITKEWRMKVNGIKLVHVIFTTCKYHVK